MAEVVECIYKVITRFGAFESLVSDLGTQLIGKITQALIKTYKIRKVHTSSMHPQSNGGCEGVNREIWRYLRHCVTDETQDQWSEFIDPMLYSLRSTVSPSTSGYLPFEILYGKPMRYEVDMKFLKEEKTSKDVECYMKTLRPRVELTDKIIKENRMEARLKTKKYYDKNSVEPTFEIGDCVYMTDMGKTVGLSPKLKRKYHAGPFIKVQKDSKNSYKLRNAVTDKPVAHTVNGNKLKHCNPPAEKFYSKVIRAQKKWEKQRTQSKRLATDWREDKDVSEEGATSQQVDISGEQAQAADAGDENRTGNGACDSPVRAMPDQQPTAKDGGGDAGGNADEQAQSSDDVNSGADRRVSQQQMSQETAAGEFKPTANDKQGGWSPIREIAKRKGEGNNLFFEARWMDNSVGWVCPSAVSLRAKQEFYKREKLEGRCPKRKRRVAH